jgi:hypothetical protein
MTPVLVYDWTAKRLEELALSQDTCVAEIIEEILDEVDSGELVWLD